MEKNKVIPDEETGEIILNIFGKIRKTENILFKN